MSRDRVKRILRVLNKQLVRTDKHRLKAKQREECVLLINEYQLKLENAEF